MIEGIQYHSIVKSIFGDVRGFQKSSQIQICCPRCQEQDGLFEPDDKFNLEINTAKRLFRCWKCGDPPFSGSLRKLIKLYGSSVDVELFDSYGSLSGNFEYDFDEDYEPEEIEFNVQLPSEFISFADMSITDVEHFEAYNYMVNERKIDRELLLKYKIGFALTGKYEKRIIFPSYGSDGRLNYFVARNYDTSNKLKKPYDNPKINKSNIIFNDLYLNYDSTIYLCEGVFEMLSFPINTVPMLGKTIGDALFMKLKEMKPDVVILLDPDAYKNAIDLYYKLNAIYDDTKKVKIVKLPNNDDLDELRRDKGKEEIIKWLRTARGLEIDDYFIKNLSSTNVHKRKDRRNDYSEYLKWEKRI